MIVENGKVLGVDRNQAKIANYLDGTIITYLWFTEDAAKRLAEIEGAQIVCEGQTYTFSTESVTFDKWQSITPKLTDAEWDW